MTTLTMNLGENSYPIIVGRDILSSADSYFNLKRRVLIVTDDGVPNKYAQTIANLSLAPNIITVKSGEGSKSLSTLESLLLCMLENEFGRDDCVVAVGGGVVGDLAGFAASVYMRGIDFYNVPTTLLSQVDSSIGGKTAVNLGGVKNNVGSFKQPGAVLIDIDTLKTLSQRQLASGLAEAIKMSLTSDAALFDTFKRLSKEDIYDNIEEIIVRSLLIKKDVVEKDEKESGLRKILNFGHTLGHGIEALEGMGGLSHGECVALGMLPVSSENIRKDLVEIFKKIGLPYKYDNDISEALSFISHDKKRSANGLSVIRVDIPGEHIIEKMSVEDFRSLVLKLQ